METGLWFLNSYIKRGVSVQGPWVPLERQKLVFLTLWQQFRCAPSLSSSVKFTSRLGQIPLVKKIQHLWDEEQPDPEQDLIAKIMLDRLNPLECNCKSLQPEAWGCYTSRIIAMSLYLAHIGPVIWIFWGSKSHNNTCKGLTTSKVGKVKRMIPHRVNSDPQNESAQRELGGFRPVFQHCILKAVLA